MTFPKLPFAYVRWDDASSPGAADVFSLDNIAAVHGCMPIVTAGWVLKEDAEGITLASEFCGGTEFRGLTHVRAAMITEVHRVPAPRPKKKRPPKEPSLPTVS